MEQDWRDTLGNWTRMEAVRGESSRNRYKTLVLVVTNREDWAGLHDYRVEHKLLPVPLCVPQSILWIVARRPATPHAGRPPPS